MKASQQDSLGGKHFHAALVHVKAPFILTPWEISFHSLFFHNLMFTFSTNTYIKNKGRQQGEKPPFKQLGCKKKKKKKENLRVWLDVAPAGRRVERAGVWSGGVQVRGQRGGNEWRQAVLSAVSPWHCLATCQARFAACQAAARDGTGRRRARTRRRGRGGCMRDRWTGVCRSMSGQEDAITGTSKDTLLVHKGAAGVGGCPWQVSGGFA